MGMRADVRESLPLTGAAANLSVEGLNDVVGEDPRPMFGQTWNFSFFLEAASSTIFYQSLFTLFLFIVKFMILYFYLKNFLILLMYAPELFPCQGLKASLEHKTPSMQKRRRCFWQRCDRKGPTLKLDCNSGTFPIVWCMVVHGSAW